MGPFWRGVWAATLLQRPLCSLLHGTAGSEAASIMYAYPLMLCVEEEVWEQLSLAISADDRYCVTFKRAVVREEVAC